MGSAALAATLILVIVTLFGALPVYRRSARGLAKGRFRLTLYMFLQDHYASNSSSAWALTSYLESVDEGKRGPSRAAAKPLLPTSV